MGKHILILVGSFRLQGCTQAAAETAKTAFENSGKTVEMLNVANMNICGCIGCEQCWTDGNICTQHDDMDMVYEAIDKADLILLATPMYYAAMSAQIKAVVDRFHAIRKSCKRTQIHLVGKECALLVIGHVLPEEKYAGIILQHQLMCDHLLMTNAGTFQVRGCFHEGDFQKTEDGAWPERVAKFAQIL